MFYNFENVELVHIGRDKAHIVSVTGDAITYVNEAGKTLRVDLAECRRMYHALEMAGGIPPTDSSDWAAAWDALSDSQKKEPGFFIGMRARMDEPPWFQFTNRRRTQFEFVDGEAMDALLLGPLYATEAPAHTFDCS
jgi:hypothetical protein